MNSGYFNLLRNVYFGGDTIVTRGLETKEKIAQNLLLSHYNAISTRVHRPWEQIKEYLYPELAWYMSGDRNIDKIRPYSRFWETIRNPDKTINSNYGDLVFYRQNSKGVNSFDWALYCLSTDTNTRKGIVLYNDRELFFHDNKDLICNQYQQFLIRHNHLICLVTLRSSDMIYGLTFNMPWWSLVHQQMFLKLKRIMPNLQLGSILAFLGSVHIYKNKYLLAENMILDEKEHHFLKLSEPLPLNRSFEEYMEIIPETFKEEKSA